MAYVKQVVEDGVTSDIKAVALDSTLDATLLHKSELVDGFTQTTAGVNALDAHAGKTLNDTLKNFKTDSNLTTTIDTPLANGFYAMNGSSAVGTFPDSTGKYGVLQSIKRGNNTFQMLFTEANMWTREVGSSVGDWHSKQGEHEYGTVTANATTQVTVNFGTSSARLLVIGHGSYANSRGVYILTSSNEVFPVIAGSNMTVSMSGGKVSIVNSSNAARYLII